MRLLVLVFAVLIQLMAYEADAANSTLGGVNIVIGNACPQNGDTVFNDSATHIVVCTGGVWTAWSGGGGGSIDGLSDAFTDYTTNHNFIMGGNPAGTAVTLTNGAQNNTFIGEGAGPTAANSTATTDGNTALGYAALTNLKAGGQNTAIGNQTLTNVTSGSENTAVGFSAGLANTTGNQNMALGGYANRYLTTGSDNVAMGYQANYNSTTSSYNVAVGSFTLNGNVAKIGSTAIGFEAMRYADSTASAGNALNTAIGYQALRGSTTAANNTGASNVAIGANAGDANTSGNDNVFIGANAGGANTTASFGTIIGRDAGAALTTGGYNTIIGRVAGNAMTTGNNNVVLGEGAGMGMTTGYGNVIIGVDSGNSLGGSNYSIILGASADISASYNLNIGNAIYGTIGTTDGQAQTKNDNSAAIRIDGSLQLGTSAATCNAAAGGMMRYNSGTKKMQFCNETAWTDM